MAQQWGDYSGAYNQRAAWGQPQAGYWNHQQYPAGAWNQAHTPNHHVQPQAPPAHPATASYDNGPRELARGVWLSQITDHPNQGDASVQATLRIPAEKMGLLEGENIGVQKHIQEQAKVRLETKELEQNPQPYRDLLIKARLRDQVESAVTILQDLITGKKQPKDLATQPATAAAAVATESAKPAAADEQPADPKNTDANTTVKKQNPPAKPVPATVPPPAAASPAVKKEEAAQRPAKKVRKRFDKPPELASPSKRNSAAPPDAAATPAVPDVRKAAELPPVSSTSSPSKRRSEDPHSSERRRKRASEPGAHDDRPSHSKSSRLSVDPASGSRARSDSLLRQPSENKAVEDHRVKTLQQLDDLQRKRERRNRKECDLLSAASHLLAGDNKTLQEMLKVSLADKLKRIQSAFQDQLAKERLKIHEAFASKRTEYLSR